jgi:regulator of protease activity HflC (stomatin/prohibitin superfamily)
MAPVLLAVSVLVVAWVASGVRVVRPHERAALERFGKYRKTVGPGFHIALPGVHRLRRVDERELLVDVRANCLTKDGVEVGLDVSIMYACVDVRQYLYDVADPPLAIIRAATTGMRDLIGLITVEALDHGDQLAGELWRWLEDQSTAWGVRLARVDILAIELPSDVMAAMHERAASERRCAALALKAERRVQQAVAKAEAAGRARRVEAAVERELVVMEAQAEADATRVLADAALYRQQSLARAHAEAIKIVSAAVGSQAPDLVAVKYLEALVPMVDPAGAAGVPTTELPSVLKSLDRAVNGSSDGLVAAD